MILAKNIVEYDSERVARASGYGRPIVTAAEFGGQVLKVVPNQVVDPHTVETVWKAISRRQGRYWLPLPEDDQEAYRVFMDFAV